MTINMTDTNIVKNVVISLLSDTALVSEKIAIFNIISCIEIPAGFDIYCKKHIWKNGHKTLQLYNRQKRVENFSTSSKVSNYITGWFNILYLYILDVQLKSGPNLIWVIYLLRFTTCYITQLICIYSKCWKWCPFISMHLSTRFIMFLATFLSGLSFFNYFRNSTFHWRMLLKYSKKLCLQWT
jgi:hypothetical protein